jgi:hypothetical protein
VVAQDLVSTTVDYGENEKEPMALMNLKLTSGAWHYHTIPTWAARAPGCTSLLVQQ